MTEDASLRPRTRGLRSRGVHASGEPGGPSVLVLPEVGGIPAGWRTIGAKEFADHLLSVRFLILLLLLGIVGVGTVYTAASAIRDVATQAAGAPGLFLKVFTISPAATAVTSQFPSFVVLIGFLGPLLGIAFGFDAVSSERSEGTLPRLLSQPIHRDDVVNGKFLAGLTIIALILGTVAVFVGGVAMVRLGIVPTGDEAVRMVGWFVMALVYVSFWLAFATLCSVVFRRAATSALLAIAVWIVMTLFLDRIVSVVAGFLRPVGDAGSAAQQLANASFQLNLARLAPSRLYEEITGVLLDPSVRTVNFVLPEQANRAIPSILPVGQSLLIIWPQAVALIALTVMCFAAAYIRFMRQEVRA